MAKIGSQRALFGYVNGHGVLLERLLTTPEPPTIGYAMTWEAYAAITPENDKYYAVYDGAPGTAINNIVTLTYEEYSEITPQATTVYQIIDPTQGGLIYDMKYGTDTVDILYLGSTESWSFYTFAPSKELSDAYNGVTYQTIWDNCKNADGFVTDYYYIYVDGEYGGKPQFKCYKFNSGEQIRFSSTSSGLYRSSKQYSRQELSVYWNSRQGYWGTSTSTATNYVYLPTTGLTPAPDICTAIRLYVSSLDLKIRAHS
jgi:hypothetical protein